MRKCLVVLATMFLLGVYGFAEMKSGDKTMKTDAGIAKKGHMMKDCLTMKDGKMMMITKDGKKKMMNADMDMPNGTMMMKDGTCVMKDGTKMVMKEGDRMDMEGNMMKKKKTPEKKVK